MSEGRKVISVPMDLFREAEENHDALGIADSRGTLVIATSVGMLALLMCRYARESGIDNPVIELRIRAGTHRSAAVVGEPQALPLSDLRRQS